MQQLQPPAVQTEPHERTHHGDTVDDPFFWLADKENKDVIAYLEAENTHTEASTAGQAELRETIFQEIKRRTKETDLTVPVRQGAWWYYSRTEEGSQYGIHCRVPAADERPPALPEDGSALPGEQILIDGNEMARGHEFFAMGTFEITSDGTRLAYSVDFAGDERFTLKVRDLETGLDTPTEIPGVAYGSAWSADGSVLFYLTVDEAWRPDTVHRHVIGTPVSEDAVVLHEPDERFWIDVGTTRSERYLEISVSSKLTSESWLLRADDPMGELTVVAPREQGVEYEVDHWAHPDDPARDLLLVLHNRAGRKNFELATAPIDRPAEWTALVAHSSDTRLLGVDAYATHLVVEYRRDGLTGLAIHPIADGRPAAEGTPITFDEPVYTVSPDDNPRFEAEHVRLTFTSMVTPASVFDYDIPAGALTLLKQKPVLGGYDPADYEQRRVWATAADGARVPMSLVYRRGLPADGSAPALLYGYGSYEMSMDPYFSVPRLSLLDRGFIYAIAHVRGGGELGRDWYDDGKMLAKRNTFTDFVACARALCAPDGEGLTWTSADRLVARGGSAGGLLMGAAANLAPDGFVGILAEVPFVDALNTILDPSLPMTVMEWEEWGNPLESPEVYEYMKSYSPYENVQAVDYPAILAVTSLNDTRVYYHEPAKWIARLRGTATGGEFLLKTEIEAGHAGRSGRYDAWREESFNLAWVITTATGGDPAAAGGPAAIAAAGVSTDTAATATAGA
jgi:oligopeptidase B